MPKSRRPSVLADRPKTFYHIRSTTSRAPLRRDFPISPSPIPSSDEDRNPPTPDKNRRPPPPSTIRFSDDLPSCVRITRGMSLSRLSTTAYSEDQIVKALGIATPHWDVLKDGLMGVFHDNPELNDLAGVELCQKLNDMCMTPSMGLGDLRRAGHAYYMFHAALYAREKQTKKAKQAEVDTIEELLTKIKAQSDIVDLRVKRDVGEANEIVRRFKPGVNFAETKRVLEAKSAKYGLAIRSLSDCSQVGIRDLVNAVIVENNEHLIKQICAYMNTHFARKSETSRVRT